MIETLANKVKRRLAHLKELRAPFDSRYAELARFFLPFAGRFTPSDRDQDKSLNSIIDNSGMRALSTLRSLLISGASSPAKPWFKLAMKERDLNESPRVSRYTAIATQELERAFREANIYRALASCHYTEMPLFGTSAGLLLAHPDRAMWHHNLTCGQYWLAQDQYGVVDTIYRTFEMTAAQAVAQFGRDRVSRRVSRCVENGRPDESITVIHAIEPRQYRSPRRSDSLDMPWRSVYIEESADRDDVLEESGFRSFPALTPRSDTFGGDVYGRGPGMVALPDNRALQHQQRRKANAIDYKSNPPLQGPSKFSAAVDRRPGGYTPVDTPGQTPGIRTLFEANLDIRELNEDSDLVRRRIESAFGADAALMLYSVADTAKTAYEAAELRSEKFMILSPLLDSVHTELLRPLIDRGFELLFEAGRLPDPPPELEGQEMDVEFVSLLAQAQRALGANATDRWLNTLAALQQIDPAAADKLNVDSVIDDYAQMLGVNPNNVRTDEEVAEVRRARAQAMAMQEQAAVQRDAAAAVRDYAAAAPSQAPPQLESPGLQTAGVL